MKNLLLTTFVLIGMVFLSKAQIKVASDEKAKNAQIKVYTDRGINLQKKGNFAGSILAFDSALAINPKYVKAISLKASSYMSLANYAKVTETVDLIIIIANETNDVETSKQFQNKAKDYFKEQGLNRKLSKNSDEVLDLFNTSLKYGEDMDVYYYIAKIYNSQLKNDLAITNAQKGLDLKTGLDERAKGKLYFQLAEAQERKFYSVDACGNYKKAMADEKLVMQCQLRLKNLKCK